MENTPVTKNIPVLDECDVLVCGAGPAGFAAAVAASRHGAKTVLIERYGFPGGMMTAAMVNPIYGFYARHLQVIRGIGQELIDELMKIPGATLGHTYRQDCIAVRHKRGECLTGTDEGRCPVGTVAKVCPVDSELVKVVMMQMLVQSNVRVIYHAWVTGTILDRDIITDVIIQGKSGKNRIRAKVVIDTTGDADVSAFSNVKFAKGFGEKQISKPPSLKFKIMNADLNRDRIKIPLPHTETGEESYAWLMALPEKGAYTINAPSGILDFDSTETVSLSNGQESTTLRMFKLFEWIKENVKGCQNIKLHSFAANIGIRESRRIEGKYVLTEEDVQSGRKFPKSGITNGVHPIDLHLKDKSFNNKNLIPARCGDYYQIPYECLVPVGVANLLVAGRSISATFLAQGSLRVMATCMGMGQAAGTAAALAVSKANNQVGSINTDELRSLLIRDGVYLGEEDRVPAWNMGEEPLPAEIQKLNDSPVI